ncbi:MAG: glycosyltransferase family 2 protein [Candidatus Wildermuthbacteria bacterium]|nr:glycosyltransferase family 2 protein [Candidatus Wildermuthbacteria bacterium]
MISVIIPAYNEEKYIGKCLQSLASQKTAVPFEVIVVDNNSKDATSQIVARDFSSFRLVKETQQGMTKARNRGAREAKGDIFAFLDADCMAPPLWIENISIRFSKNPNLLGVSGPSNFYDLPWQYKWVEFVAFKIVFPFIGEFLLKTILRKGALWNGANIAVRKDIFEKVGGFAEHIVFYGEDADLAKKFMQQGKTAFARETWVYTSARRLLKGNPAKEGLAYFLQYAWFLVTNKSRATSYKEVR